MAQNQETLLRRIFNPLLHTLITPYRNIKRAQQAIQQSRDQANQAAQLKITRDKAIRLIAEPKPYPVTSFLMDFKPQSETQVIAYESIMNELHKDNTQLVDICTDLAKIGDETVIRAMCSDPTMYETASARLAMFSNPNCPDDLLYAGMCDTVPEVRKAAVLHPTASKEELMEHAKNEKHPIVIEALKQRLGKDYAPAQPKPPLDNIIDVASLQSQEKTITTERHYPIIRNTTGPER